MRKYWYKIDDYPVKEVICNILPDDLARKILEGESCKDSHGGYTIELQICNEENNRFYYRGTYTGWDNIYDSDEFCGGELEDIENSLSPFDYQIPMKNPMKDWIDVGQKSYPEKKKWPPIDVLMTEKRHDR